MQDSILGLMCSSKTAISRSWQNSDQWVEIKLHESIFTFKGYANHLVDNNASTISEKHNYKRIRQNPVKSARGLALIWTSGRQILTTWQCFIEYNYRNITAMSKAGLLGYQPQVKVQKTSKSHCRFLVLAQF